MITMIASTAGDGCEGNRAIGWERERAGIGPGRLVGRCRGRGRKHGFWRFSSVAEAGDPVGPEGTGQTVEDDLGHDTGNRGLARHIGQHDNTGFAARQHRNARAVAVDKAGMKGELLASPFADP